MHLWPPSVRVQCIEVLPITTCYSFQIVKLTHFAYLCKFSCYTIIFWIYFAILRFSQYLFAYIKSCGFLQNNCCTLNICIFRDLLFTLRQPKRHVLIDQTAFRVKKAVIVCGLTRFLVQNSM
jgi:hypothetical protein